jgi:hypothetical protein
MANPITSSARILQLGLGQSDSDKSALQLYPVTTQIYMIDSATEFKSKWFGHGAGQY